MRKAKIITIMLAAVAGAAIAFISNNGIELKQEAWAFDQPSFETKLTGSTGSGDALIELTPKIDSNKLVVKFNINTHSVRLSRFDLEDITTLEYDNKIVKPKSASRIGGHHSSGTIVFEARADLNSFIIRIKGIPGVNERIYTWNAG